MLIIGGGNAALCAALAARENGAEVTVLERAPQDEGGGNSRFTAEAFRCAYSGVEDLIELMPDLTDDEIAMTDFGTYTEDQFFNDMFRVTNYRCDPDLVECLVRQSAPTMSWMMWTPLPVGLHRVSRRSVRCRSSLTGQRRRESR